MNANKKSGVLLISCIHFLLGLQTLQAEPKYFSEVKQLSYPTSRTGSKIINPDWDLTRGKVYTYDYNQLFDVKMEFGNLPEITGPMRQEIKAKGLLYINSMFNDTANARIQLEANMDSLLPTGERQQKTEKMPVKQFAGMSEYGRFKDLDPEFDVILKSMLALPGISIKLGESITIPAKILFDVNNIKHTPAGELIMTLAEFVDHHGRTCAQFDTSLRITEYRPPADVTGKFKVDVTVRGKSFFDIEQKQLVEAILAMQTRINATVPAEAETGQDTHEFVKNAPHIDLAGQMNTLVKVSLKPKQAPQRLHKFNRQTVKQ